MSSRVLLISANRCTTPDPVFPLGLSYLNAALRQAGHQTAWVDRLANWDSLVETLQSFRPDFVGISLRNIDDVLIRKRESFFDELTSLVSTIRHHTSAILILGGSGFSIFPEELLKLSGTEYGITGAGESSLVDLISALVHRLEVTDIAGLVYRKDNDVRVNPAAPTTPGMELTEADAPVEVVQHYLAATGMLNLQTQRGCHFHCCYCTYPNIEGRVHCKRPPEQVASDLDLLRRRGARFAFIVDSVFNSSTRHVVDTCEAILRRGVRMSWGCFLRPQGLTQELMSLMARAGLTHAEFGSDSFSDVTLANYEKNFTFEDICHSSELARQHRVEHCHFLICGGPGETEETMQESFDNSLRFENTIILAVVGMRIYPGTPLWQRASREGRISPVASLLTPDYYLSSDLTEERIYSRLEEFALRSPGWIVRDPGPDYLALTERLRKRGISGPLWGYLSTAQRLWQSPTPAIPSK